jgi:dolichol-phosphate mannosyltransferase
LISNEKSYIVSSMNGREKQPETKVLPTYSLVIPVHNEEANLSLLIHGLKPVMDKIGKPYEIILVDDGSTDGSYGKMAELQSAVPQLVLVRFRGRNGQTAAFDAGFHRAKGTVVITLDADLQYDPEDIPNLLSHLDEADVVCGWRGQRADNLVRRVSSVIANAVRNRFSHDQVRDVGCSLRAIKREGLDRIKLYEGMHRFLPTLLKMEGMRIVEVPVHHRPRLYGNTKYNIRNRLFKSLMDLFAIRWMKRRWLHYEIEEVRTWDPNSGSSSD